MPTTIAPTQAQGIGSGGFGGLRAQTAVDTAKTNAMSTLQAQQMQAALQNQQTGATAGGALGNVGAQGITSGLTTGAAQMNAPFQGATNYANLVNAVNVPGTVSTQNQQSPLQMVSTLAGLPAVGTSLLNSVFGSPSTGGSPTLPNGQPNPNYVKPTQGLLPTLQNQFPSIFGSGSGSGATQSGGTIGGGTTPGTYPLSGGGSMVVSPDGSKIVTQGDGTVQAFDKDGTPLGGTTNAGDVAPGGVTEQDLYNQQSGNTTYTPDQLDQYQNSYDNTTSPTVDYSMEP
jgi:hypothetical protein